MFSAVAVLQGYPFGRGYLKRQKLYKSNKLSLRIGHTLLVRKDGKAGASSILKRDRPDSGLSYFVNG